MVEGSGGAPSVFQRDFKGFGRGVAVANGLVQSRSGSSLPASQRPRDCVRDVTDPFTSTDPGAEKYKAAGSRRCTTRPSPPRYGLHTHR